MSRLRSSRLGSFAPTEGEDRAAVVRALDLERQPVAPELDLDPAAARATRRSRGRVSVSDRRGSADLAAARGGRRPACRRSPPPRPGARSTWGEAAARPPRPPRRRLRRCGDRPAEAGAANAHPALRRWPSTSSTSRTLSGCAPTRSVAERRRRTPCAPRRPSFTPWRSSARRLRVRSARSARSRAPRRRRRLQLSPWARGRGEPARRALHRRGVVGHDDHVRSRRERRAARDRGRGGAGSAGGRERRPPVQPAFGAGAAAGARRPAARRSRPRPPPRRATRLPSAFTS